MQHRKAILVPTLRATDGCINPGDNMCTVIIAGGVFGNPVTGAISGDRYVDVANGACESIVSSGELEPQSPGFYANFSNGVWDAVGVLG
jgi:hypothetical protein